MHFSYKPKYSFFIILLLFRGSNESLGRSSAPFLSSARDSCPGYKAISALMTRKRRLRGFKIFSWIEPGNFDFRGTLIAVCNI